MAMIHDRGGMPPGVRETDIPDPNEGKEPGWDDGPDEPAQLDELDAEQ